MILGSAIGHIPRRIGTNQASLFAVHESPDILCFSNIAAKETVIPEHIYITRPASGFFNILNSFINVKIIFRRFAFTFA